jgi:hypothetical protein
MYINKTHNQVLKDKIDLTLEFLIDDKKTDITKLNEEEKGEIAALLIMMDDRVSAFEAIAEARNSDDYPNLLAKYMFSHDEDDREDLVNLMIKGATNYYETRIEELLKNKIENMKLDELENICIARNDSRFESEHLLYN